jgi:hydrogenase maturation protein HypF
MADLRQVSLQETEGSMATSSNYGPMIPASRTIVRRLLEVRGIVQGVGFRPLVYSLACELGLSGFVRNIDGRVQIALQGSSETIDEFVERLSMHPPSRASIERLEILDQDPVDEVGFAIVDSLSQSSGHILISADIATCPECLKEMADPADRRFEYPFLNCTQCGPRLTIVEAAPYDRVRTTMARFEMCDDCRREYSAPLDRRFHAQPVACPACGPQLQFHPTKATHSPFTQPLAEAVAAVRSGQIVAVKGLGGYHLVCDAQNSAAVSELRCRKSRDERPFAIMLPDLVAAEKICTVTALERIELQSPRRPIVLLRRRPLDSSAPNLAPQIAFGNPRLGVMLPYSPLHHLLLAKLDGMPLVMTSANRAEQPILFDDNLPVQELQVMADAVLTHDRPIRIRCDDSVVQVIGDRVSLLRRSRGYAPEPVRLPMKLHTPILALGGQQKNTIALGIGENAILSHHLGDLHDLESCRSFQETIRHYGRLFDMTPQWIVHDQHPDYASTRYAEDLNVTPYPTARLLAVQHHHAHMASCMAEHELQGSVIGVIFDGTGLGTDGTFWGGEFLIGDYTGFRRAAHLRPVRMPGGEQAIHEPRRMAVAHLLDADLNPTDVLPLLSTEALANLRRIIQQGINSPLTSSAGRLFDAVAAIAGVRQTVSYEGQAAVELEWLAADSEATRHPAPDDVYPFKLSQSQATLDALEQATLDALEIDTRPLIAAIWKDVLDQTHRRTISRRFHSTLAAIIIRCCERLRQTTGIDRVVLSGGVFQNAILSSDVFRGLEQVGFQTYSQQLVPCNDGGLSLGQVAVAAALQDGLVPTDDVARPRMNNLS